jgi:hypothetical protein
MAFDLARRAVMTSLGYYARRAIARRRPGPSLEKVAQRTINVCRTDSLAAIRPYFREDQTGRIRDSESFTSRQIVEEHLNRQTIVLHPLQVHEFQDAYLIDGSVYLGGAIRFELRSTPERTNGLRRWSLLPTTPQAECSEAALVAGVAGSTWFGHWLEDEVPLQMLAAEFGPPVAHVRPEYPHEADYRKLLQLDAPMRLGTAHVSRLTVVDEFAQNPSKARRYWRIRERLALDPKGADRVFLNRGSSGNARLLRNEAELLQRFRADGYAIIDIATASLDDLLKSLNGAFLVVGVEGSHLAHALYAMAEFGNIVILNPPQRAYTTVADIAPFCSLHASMYICSPNDDGSFHADIDELLAFIDEAIADSKARRGNLERFLDSLRQRSISGLS